MNLHPNIVATALLFLAGVLGLVLSSYRISHDQMLDMHDVPWFIAMFVSIILLAAGLFVIASYAYNLGYESAMSDLSSK